MTNDVAVYDSSADAANGLLVGGFGPLRDSHSRGIELFGLIEDAGRGADDDMTCDCPSPLLRHHGLLSDVPSPTWLERDGQVVYAVLEDTNEVAALRIDRIDDGKTDASVAGGRGSLQLTSLSRVAVPGSSPTHAIVAVDDAGMKHLLVADYADGTVCVFPLAGDGSVLPALQVLHGGSEHGPLPAQEGPHAHWVLQLPDGRVLSTDLGADRIYVHRWDHSELVRVGMVRLNPGTGPRDMHLMPVSKDSGWDWCVAVVGEWGNDVTVLVPTGEDGAGMCAAENTADYADDADAVPDVKDIIVAQTIALGGDPADQAASLAYVPESTYVGGTDAGDADGGAIGDPAGGVDGASRGMAYVGLRGSERIVALRWNGHEFSRLAADAVEDWRGRGVCSGGSRPRHLKALGNLLIAANEVSDNLTVFRIARDGAPRHIVDVPTGSPTVVLPL